MELNKSKIGILSPVVPLFRKNTLTGEIRHGMVAFPGNGAIPSSLTCMFSYMSIKIICSGHKKQPH